MMSGAVIFWKMRQSEFRVRNQSQGTTSARYARRPFSSSSPAENRLTKPLKCRSESSARRMLNVTFLPSNILAGDAGVVRNHVEREAKELRDAFLAGEAGEHEHVVAQRRLEVEQTS